MVNHVYAKVTGRDAENVACSKREARQVPASASENAGARSQNRLVRPLNDA
jgi:hypothetical protein